MIKETVKHFAAEFENEIEKLFVTDRAEYSIVSEAMKYSLADGGKRLRPFLIDRFFKAAGGEGNKSINFQLAMECIHTYSLIHDDLPCMDNDDMRRGKPSCHKKFGEEYALLAGDGLLTLAFNIASKTEGVSADKILNAINILSFEAGIDGMIGGQTVDLLSEGKSDVTTDLLTLICRLKTGALIKASCLIGTVLAGGDERMQSAAKEFAENLGLAFQIVDDILDVVGDEAKLGKPINSDAENEKSTIVSILGIEKCKELVLELTEKAKSSLLVFGEKAEKLKELADYLCIREY
ncbi:MAG: polyprenyl synthetase family protein [Clostridia bacterium]|nr:polyprenyl synthetase family protein [Clostridia bacterium]